MPACFARFGAACRRSSPSRGLLAGRVRRRRGVRAADAGRGAQGGPGAGRCGTDRRQRRLDGRVLAAVPALAPDPPRPADHSRLPLPGRRPGATALVALVPGLPYYLVGVGWVFAGLGMGLAVSSTSLALMTLSRDRRAGPQRLLPQPVRCPRRRPVRRRLRHDLRGAADHHRPLRDLRRGDRGDGGAGAARRARPRSGSARCATSSPALGSLSARSRGVLARAGGGPGGRPLARHCSSRIVTNIEIANSARPARPSST